MHDNEEISKDLVKVNRDRQNLGAPWLLPEFKNVFMRSLPGTMIETFNRDFPAGGINNLNGTIAQRRGTVQAIRIVAMSNTLADIDQDTFTMEANGAQIFVNTPIAYFTPLFDSYLDKREYVTIPQNSTFNLRVDRTNGVNALFVYIMFYYAPSEVLPPASVSDPR